MQVITANELKTKGVNSLEKALNQEDEVIISIRGKPRFVVMELEQYDRLREAEVFVGWKEASADYAKGNFEIVENVGDHIKRLKKELSNEAEVSLEAPKSNTNV
ncbi:MAG: type II toxin-antitoxin system Phd/YefM family antitoxin [SAR324 cluster bacterium]|jgi:prevent-host-death family protein|nr:type II toxin-antitoxin system Phd/YefM family antitoxin [SAR324 cluster bacterium]|tara:strand:- start:1097 stop:1408 length:312 start_codon:yes stop_codon:yes gene_type:complete